MTSKGERKREREHEAKEGKGGGSEGRTSKVDEGDRTSGVEGCGSVNRRSARASCLLSTRLLTQAPVTRQDRRTRACMVATWIALGMT